MAVMKVGGKDPNNEVKGVSVSTSGAVNTQKVWQNNVTKIYTGESPSSGTHKATQISIADCGAVSLRVNNSTDVGYTFSLYADYIGNDYVMRNVDGDIESLSIPANKGHMIITPDDWPVLQWIRQLNLRIVNSTAATTGTLEVWAVTKG